MFKKMTIGVKLMTSFCLLLVLTALVGILGYNGMGDVVRASNTLSEISNVIEHVSAARSAEKEFILTTSPDASKQLLEEIKELAEHADAAKKSQEDDTISGRIDAIQANILKYQATFQGYTQLEDRRQDAIAQMMENANLALDALSVFRETIDMELYDFVDSEVEGDVSDFQDSILEKIETSSRADKMVIFFINARKFEKQYLISSDKKYFDLLNQTIEDVLQIVSDVKSKLSSEQSVQHINKAVDSLHNYTKALEISLEMKNRQTEIQTALNDSATQVLTTSEEVRESQKQIQTQIIAKAKRNQFAVAALAILVGCILSFRISRGISKSMEKAAHMIEEMGKGHLDSRLEMKRNDEIGHMAATMNLFADNLQEEVISSLRKLEEGDLTFEVHPTDDQDVLRGALKNVGHDLNEMMLGIQQAGELIANGANQVSNSSQSLSLGATQQAAALEEITSATTEMASQTQQNADNATKVNLLMSETQKVAEKGNTQMQQMLTAMADINKSSQDISKILKSIDEIAFQTNLLALNAAVEAARAGQYGKGFAVVAEEVRNLAARSAKAASETAELITDSLKNAEAGTHIANATESALSEIVQEISKISRLVAEIAAASNEQAIGIKQVNEGLNQIDHVNQQSTADSEQSAAAAEELASQAVRLQNMLGRFQLKKAHTRAPLQLLGADGPFTQDNIPSVSKW